MKFKKTASAFLLVCLTFSAISFESAAQMQYCQIDHNEYDVAGNNEMSLEECEEIADRVGRAAAVLSESSSDPSPVFQYITIEEMDAVKRVIDAGTTIVIKEDMSALSDTGLSFSSKYFYDQLSAGLKTSYSDMYDAILNYELNGIDVTSSGFFAYVDLPDKTTRQEAEDFICVFYYGNPRFYFMDHAYSMSTDGVYVRSIAIRCNSDFISGSARTNATNMIGSVVNKVIQKTSVMSDPVEKETYIAKYICDTTQYRETGHHQSAYGSLIENTAVCAGYANAYNMLCNAAGVECITIHSPKHAWNMVKLYGSWYCTDVTWMDGYSINGMYVETWHNKSYSTFLTNSLSSEYPDAHDIEDCLSKMTVPDCIYDNVVTPGAGVAIDKNNFPDAVFRQYITDNFDIDNDNILSDVEIANITEINVDDFDGSVGAVYSLKGIEFFKGLEYLDCNYQPITELNVSANKKLTILSCGGCSLKSLDLRSNPLLRYLECRDNEFASLDLSGNLELETIFTDKDIIIYGIKGSYAETYANKNSITFVIKEEMPDTPTVSGTITVSGGAGAVEGTAMEIKKPDGTSCGATIDIDENGMFAVTGTLPDGDYTITASKSKCCPRDYSVTIEDGQMQGGLEVELQLYGDIDNNGIINILDALEIINYSNKKESRINMLGADEGYLLRVGNLNGDENTNLIDALEIINYSNKKASAFDKIA